MFWLIRKICIPECAGNDRPFLLHSGGYFFVSQALGANGLTALNLAIPVYSFINGSGLMIGMGGGTKYSIFKSQENKERADQIFTNGAAMTAVIAGIFFLLGIFAAGPLIRLLEQMTPFMKWGRPTFG